MSDKTNVKAAPLDAEDEEYRDVFTRFGLAAYRVQCLETLLISFLLLDARLNGTAPTVADVEALEVFLQKKKTLGVLISDLRKRVSLPARAEEIMGLAVDKRNFLIHHFFRERAFEFATDAGRKRMLDELRETQAVVYLAEGAAKDLCLALAKVIGLTPEHIEAEVERLRQESISAEKGQGGSTVQ
jgi:hypothetical protein